jgi:hypothetical protein
MWELLKDFEQKSSLAVVLIWPLYFVLVGVMEVLS